MAEGYVCTLTDFSVKVAKDELHEDPKERLGAAIALRDWVMSQPHIKCDPSIDYMLRFLRVSKFSQLIARRRLEGWLNELDKRPKWLRNIDTADPDLQRFFGSGYTYNLPGTDKLGRRVTLIKPSAMDMSQKNDVFYRGFLAMWISLLYDENCQVNGTAYFLDMTGVEMKHLTHFGMDKAPQMIKIWQGIFPGRFKAMHYYNHGAVLEAFLALTKPVMSKKFSERIILHGNNLEKVYKVIPMEILPQEYLPDDYTGKCAGPAKALIEDLKNGMKRPEIRDRILYETGPAFGFDESKVIKGEPEAAFRKLNID